jgi:hypothetical protein
MLISDRQIEDLKNLILNWLKEKDIPAGVLVQVQMIPNRVIVSGVKVRKGNRTVLRDLSKNDWETILSLPMPEDIRRALVLLKEKGNRGIVKGEMSSNPYSFAQRLNTLFRKNNSIYRITHTHGGNVWIGPLRIAIIR